MMPLTISAGSIPSVRSAGFAVSVPTNTSVGKPWMLSWDGQFVFFVGVHFHDANRVAEFRLDLLELRRDQHARAAPRGEEVDDQRGGAIL